MPGADMLKVAMPTRRLGGRQAERRAEQQASALPVVLWGSLEQVHMLLDGIDT